MAVFINLDRSLVFQVLVNREIQRVAYEALLMIYFSCGKYGHAKEMCLSLAVNPVSESKKVATTGKSDSRGLKDKGTEKETLSSRFAALNGMGEMIVDEGGAGEKFLGKTTKRNEGEATTSKGTKARDNFKEKEGLRLGISRGLDVGFEAQEGTVQ
ncbi:hypothetical protein PVK06_017296 [Gossypium arboreum]|uniref:Uncharacterized protein n=1 Tax=Gossypium arboreum TaxID=29729 RepID=A0ABR0Q341_GOSAR|nr:hypothetical protein PVK06_017296 [Gossypium arboreum]